MSVPSPITIQSDTLTATILPLGAALVGLRFAGRPRNMVIGFADPEDHQNIAICAGSLVGPIANRIAGGEIEIAAAQYQMPQNEDDNCLHSGPEGLHAQIWQVAAQSSDHLRLSCDLADGTNGLPGNRRVEATYRVQGSTLTLTITATTDKSTAMNIAAHPYWNLDGQPDVSGHEICVNAANYLPTDDAQLPTGDLTPTRASAFDFNKSAPVPLNPALDTNFCLADAPRDTPQLAATLRGADGTQLQIATTAPGLQVYAGAGLPEMAVGMADCPPLRPYSGIALEPQHWPDAPHHSHFPQITLHPGETYTQTTYYTLTRPDIGI